MSRIALCGAAALVILFVVFEPCVILAKENSYEVWYTSTNSNDPVREDYFSTAGAAEQEATRMMRDRDSNTVRGIGNVWVTGPDGTPIWKNGQKINPPERRAPKQADLTPARKTPTVDPGTVNPHSVKSKLAGKTGRGKIGKYNVAVQFLTTGEMTISGDLTGQGKWSEPSLGDVYLETAISTFRGKIDGENVSGLRFIKDNKDGEAPVDWKVTLRADILAGTVWDGRSLGYAEGGELRFNDDGSVTRVTGFLVSGSPLVEQGSYTLDGQTIKFQIKRKVQGWFERYSGTLSGNKMSGTYTVDSFDGTTDWESTLKQ